jgi:tetratricopeptide (TPR) repeat protein
MHSIEELEQSLALGVCAVKPDGRRVRGTGWRVDGSGLVVTAGHLLARQPSGSPTVRFANGPDRPARVLLQRHEPRQGIDFAILEIAGGGGPSLPVSLERAPRGHLMSMGYGVTLAELSAAGGEIIGPFDPESDPELRLLRCRSAELAEAGYSGAPIVSVNSRAVVGVQIEAVTDGGGAAGTVLAMPLYRIAREWPRLEEIEATQVSSRDTARLRRVLVVAPPDNDVAGALHERPSVGLPIDVLTVGEEDAPECLSLDLRGVSAIVLVAQGHLATDRWTRQVVTDAAIRQIPLVIAAEVGVPLPEWLQYFPRSLVSAGAVGKAVDGMVRVIAAGLDKAQHGQHLRSLAAAIEDIQHASGSPERFELLIEELHGQLSDEPARHWDPYAEGRTQESVDATSPAEELARTVGVRPFYPQHLFRDRVAEAAEISEFLADPVVGVVCLTGRAGIGKTALLAHIVNTLRHRRWLHPAGGPSVDGIAFLPTTSHAGVSADEIVLKIAQLVDAPDLMRIWSNKRKPIAQRFGEVIAAVGDRLLIVVLDDVEDVLDDDGCIVGDDELSAFLAAIVATETPLKLLIAGRESVALDSALLTRARTVVLRSGLPDDDAIQMLRELDPQRQYGLADASADALLRIAASVHRMPRGLQLVVSLLANDPLLSIDDMAAGHPVLDESLNTLIAQSHSRLDDASRWVLLSLAVLGRPAIPGAVNFVSGPFVPGADVSLITRRLVRSQIVSVDRFNRTVALHPADRAYLLARAAEQSAQALVVMRRRAADYYRSTAPAVDTMRSLEDARPMLFATEFFLAAGDLDAATETLDLIDPLLERWGHYRPVIELRESIAARQGDADLVDNAMRLGRLYWLTGDPATSVSWLSRAEASAGNSPHLAGILCDLGAARRDVGGVHESLATLLRALRLAGGVFCDGGDPLLVARCLVQLTHTLRPMGFPDVARCYSDLALALIETHDPTGGSRGAQSLRAYALLNGAISRRLLADPDTAQEMVERARTIVLDIDDRGLQAYVRCCAAGLRRDEGRPDLAIPELLSALQLYEEIEDRWGLAAASATLCWALADLLDMDAAEQFSRSGLAAADGCNPRARWSLTLAEGVVARRTGDLERSVKLITKAIDAFDAAELDLYAASARCELGLSLLLRGEGAREVFERLRRRRGIPALDASWYVLNAVGEVTRGGESMDEILGDASCAVQDLHKRAPRSAVSITLSGVVDALGFARSAQEPLPPSVTRPFARLASAPGLLADYRSVLSLLARSGLPRGVELGAAIIGVGPASPPIDPP